MKLADDQLASCYETGASPRVSALARRAGMSIDRFSKLFLREVGVRPAGYLKRRQMERGKTLLVRTNWSVADIASACCILNPETFFRLFRQVVRMTPAAYRRLHKM